MTTSVFPDQRTKTSLDFTRLRAMFFPHWTLWAIAVVALTICALIQILSRRIIVVDQSYLSMLYPLFAAVAFALFRYFRGHIFDWFLHRFWCVLMFSFSMVFAGQSLGLLSRVLFALNFPLINDLLQNADNALGLNWDAYASLILNRPWSNFVFSHAYSYFTIYALLLAPYVAILRNDMVRTIEISYLTVATIITCVVISGFFPAFPVTENVSHSTILSNLLGKGLNSLQVISVNLHALRENTVAEIDTSSSEGLICFPSFHCCMAIIIARGYRGLGVLSYAAAIATVLIIVATPVYGGHYFIDVIAGGAISAFFIYIWDNYLASRFVVNFLTATKGNYAIPNLSRALRLTAR